MNTPPPFSSIGVTDEGQHLAKRIRLVGLDVDGVLTDGGIYLGDAGGTNVELKRYEIQDGLGIKMLQKVGIKIAVITGRVSASVSLRAKELGVDDVVQDPHARKRSALATIAAKHGIPLDACAFVGDDLPDVPVLRVVGLPVAVANASADALACARYVLSRKGGDGAVREFAETLLSARGEWARLVEWYVESRSEANV